MDIALKLISDYGIPMAIFLGIAVLLWYYIRAQLDKPKTSVSGLPIDTQIDSNTKLSYHPFFANAQYRVNIEIPNLDLLPTKPVKQQMFRDILVTYFKAMIKGCQEIAETDMSQWSSEKWTAEVTKRFNDIIVESKNDSRNSGVPEIVLSKYTKWQHSTIETLFEYIMSLGSSNIFSSNISRTNTLFFLLNLLLVMTVADAERTLREVNGDVSGKLYKGMIIEE